MRTKQTKMKAVSSNYPRKAVQALRQEYAARRAAAEELSNKLVQHLEAGGYRRPSDALISLFLVDQGLAVRVPGPYGGLAVPKAAIVAQSASAAAPEEAALLELVRALSPDSLKALTQLAGGLRK